MQPSWTRWSLPIAPGSGEVGLVAKWGNLPLGYYKDPEKTARTYVTINGVRHLISGDHATVEADGKIRLLGRGSNCINSGGEKIYPEEVEAALKGHPDVFDALVVGVPDERYGNCVAAVVHRNRHQIERATGIHSITATVSGTSWQVAFPYRPPQPDLMKG